MGDRAEEQREEDGKSQVSAVAPVEPHVEGGEGGELVDHGRDLCQPVVPAGRGQELQGNTGQKSLVYLDT